VVAAQQVNCVFESDLDGEDQGQYLDGEASSVHVVAQEQVLGGLQRTASIVVDDLDEIVELPVDVPHDGHWILDFNHVGLLLLVLVCVRKMALARLMISR
jgi:hypothetical protein